MTEWPCSNPSCNLLWRNIEKKNAIQKGIWLCHGNSPEGGDCKSTWTKNQKMFNRWFLFFLWDLFNFLLKYLGTQKRILPLVRNIEWHLRVHVFVRNPTIPFNTLSPLANPKPNSLNLVKSIEYHCFKRLALVKRNKYLWSHYEKCLESRISIEDFCMIHFLSPVKNEKNGVHLRRRKRFPKK